MADPKSIRQKVDNLLTNYLRNTTSDQEILDFYGEGNIIGRKGIPESRRELLDQVLSSRGENRPELPHNFDAYDESYGDKVPKHVYETIDMPANSPTTGRPWQMNFGKFPFPHEGQATPAANQFLNDFRVPSRPVDYGFDTGPNILDRNERDIADIKEDRHSYKRTYNSSGQGKQGNLRQSKIEEIKELENRAPGYLRPSGRPATPDWWKQEGYEPPANIKDATLNTFKEAILQREGPFGSVSQLTPVRASSRELRPGGDPDWRANMYEKIGFAGPRFPQTLKTDRDVSSADVQSFVPGRERLLPIQPYTEFFEGSAPSVIGKEPAPDFTPFQKAVGTRNYLIGKNILAGRGSLGAPVRAVQATPSALRLSVKPATKALLIDAGINYVLGASPQEAIVTAGTDLISAESLGGAQTAAIERMGPRGEFVDTRSNTVLGPQGAYTKTGIAYKNGKPIVVPRGSVAGEGNILTQTQDTLKNAASVWRKRLGALGIFGH
jgi:hypothetical protein